MVTQTTEERREEELHREAIRNHTGGRAAWLYLIEQEQVNAGKVAEQTPTIQTGEGVRED